MEKTYYRSFPDYCKKQYGRKLYRVALDAGMSCPNRDGTIGKGGCIFCDEGGSGDFAIRYDGQPLHQEDLIYNHQKCNEGDYIAYFQSFTNTYAPVERLEYLFEHALSDPLFGGIAIATRPDCLDEEKTALLKRLKEKYPDKCFWVELGLQTIHPKTSLWIRRGYPLSVFDACAQRLQQAGIPFLVHLIIGLPGETQDMMLASIDHISHIGTWGVKLQLLHYLSDTDLGKMYQENPRQFHVMSQQEYIDTICRCIARLHPDIVIHRLTGDGNHANLLAPKWSSDKKHVLNQIRHELKVRNWHQGCQYEERGNNK